MKETLPEKEQKKGSCLTKCLIAIAIIVILIIILIATGDAWFSAVKSFING